MNVFVQELLASRTETTTGDSGALVLGTSGDKVGVLRGAGRARLNLDVSAASGGGGPSLDVTISALENGRTVLIGTFPQVTTTGDQETLVLEVVPGNLQIDWAISGTSPSYTFSVDAFIEE